MELIFILYKPSVPGNIGSAARAIKTMGFRELRLIKPCNHLADEAKMMAHASNDILEKAKIYPDYESATADVDFIIGTTAKRRTAKVDYYSPEESCGILYNKQSNINKAAIIFGTEESGLPNEILRKCDSASSIPLKQSYPSLNLGQSVMLYAYVFSSLEKPLKESKELTQNSYRELKSRLTNLMGMLDIPENTSLYHRVLERFSLSKADDINLLHTLSSKLDEFLTQQHRHNR